MSRVDAFVPFESVSVYSYLPGFGGPAAPAWTGAAGAGAVTGAFVGATAAPPFVALLGAGVEDDGSRVAAGVSDDNAVFELVLDVFLVATTTTDTAITITATTSAIPSGTDLRTVAS